MEIEITSYPILEKNIITYSISNYVCLAFIINTQTIDLSYSKPIKKDKINDGVCHINDIYKYVDCDKNLIGMICSCYINDNLNLF